MKTSSLPNKGSRFAIRGLFARMTQNRAARAFHGSALPSREENMEKLVKGWIQDTYLAGSPQAIRVSDFMNRLVVPAIGHIRTSAFSDDLMRRVLDEIALKQGKRATSRLCRMWLRSALRYGRARKVIDTETFFECMDVAPVTHQTRHKTPLQPRQIRDLWLDLDRLSNKRTAIGVRLLLLTFVRPYELMRAYWQEFDLEGRYSEYGPTWKVPPERVKMRSPHTVPLSVQSVRLLRHLQALGSSNNGLLFEGPIQGQPVSRQAWRDSLRSIGWAGAFTPHACRATASTLLRELDLAHNEHIEIQLGHLVRNNSRASYDFAMYLRQRHLMMQKWADYVTTLVADNTFVDA